MTHKLKLTDADGTVRWLSCFGARDMRRQLDRCKRAGLEVEVRRTRTTHRPPRNRGFAGAQVRFINNGGSHDA